jgi:hypothetical protein
MAARAQDAQGEVLAVVKRLFDGMRAGDSAMVRSVFHKDIRMISVGTRDGKTNVRIEGSVDEFANAVGTKHAEVWDERTSNEKVMIDGPLASVWTDYTFHLGSKLSHCGIDHFLLLKEDGAWKIIELSDTRRTAGCS